MIISCYYCIYFSSYPDLSSNLLPCTGEGRGEKGRGREDKGGEEKRRKEKGGEERKERFLRHKIYSFVFQSSHTEF